MYPPKSSCMGTTSNTSCFTPSFLRLAIRPFTASNICVSEEREGEGRGIGSQLASSPSTYVVHVLVHVCHFFFSLPSSFPLLLPLPPFSLPLPFPVLLPPPPSLTLLPPSLHLPPLPSSPLRSPTSVRMDLQPWNPRQTRNLSGEVREDVRGFSIATYVEYNNTQIAQTNVT